MGYKFVQQKGTVSSVADAFSELEGLAEECREIVDNASEGLSQTQRIQTFEETAGTLENLTDAEPPECVADLAIEYSEATNKRGMSRAMRCGNAVAILQAAVGACEEWLEANPDHENHDEVDDFKNEIEGAASDAEGCEFPGMYG